MSGLKTIIASLVLMAWGIFGVFELLSLKYYNSITIILIGLCFLFQRLGLRRSWSGAYKVYVDRTMGNAISGTKGTEK